MGLLLRLLFCELTYFLYYSAVNLGNLVCVLFFVPFVLLTSGYFLSVFSIVSFFSRGKGACFAMDKKVTMMNLMFDWRFEPLVILSGTYTYFYHFFILLVCCRREYIP